MCVRREQLKLPLEVETDKSRVSLRSAIKFDEQVKPSRHPIRPCYRIHAARAEMDKNNLSDWRIRIIETPTKVIGDKKTIHINYKKHDVAFFVALKKMIDLALLNSQ
jgi:hypothetical protein